jgi:hypothetical protein
MSIYRFNENATYEQIRSAARQRLTADRKAGGIRKVRADKLGPILAHHVTDTATKGEPCVTCGEDWPCLTIRTILSRRSLRPGSG